MANYNMIFSPTGGTKKVADILANSMGGQWQEIDLCQNVMPTALTADDTCMVSVPSYGGRVPSIAIARLKAFSGNGARAILVCVYGNREWEDTLTELQDALEDAGFVCTAAVAAVAEHSIFRQFAPGRPDMDDAAELADFARNIQRKLESGTFDELHLAGNHGTYKEYGGVPFKPEGNKKCVNCGLCASNCPADAIDPAAPRKTNKDKCISCMRCVSLCPQHARDLNPLVMKGAAMAMSKHLSGHKSNHLFL